MPRKKKSPPVHLVGAAKVQHETADRAQNLALYWLARFGWLTRHQIQQLCFSEVAGDNRALRTLQRAYKNGLVEKVPLPESPGGQMFAWVLTARGMKHIISVYGQKIRYPKSYSRDRVTKQFDIGDPKLHYHRFLGNQLLIDFIRGNIFSNVQVKAIWPEHELIRESASLSSHWGYVPDTLLLYTNEHGQNVILIGEVENSCRGPVKHGKKLTHWMQPYSDRLRQSGYYNGAFASHGKRYDYDDVQMIFVSATEKIFRNIYRKVNHIFSTIPEGISHLVLSKRLWVNPRQTADLLYHEFEGGENPDFLCIDTAQRVLDGQQKKRKFD